MTTWYDAIILGLKLYTIFTVAITIPFIAIKAMVKNRFNPVKTITTQLMAIYFICVFAVTFFPLPTASQAIGLTYKVQAIPGYAIWDIIMKPSVRSVLQVIFNVVMTVPAGIIMRYRFGMSMKKATLITLAISLFIEIGQLTGLFFMYHGSFRVCDVDDLILNTMGGFIGAWAYGKLGHLLPSVEGHEFCLGRRKIAHI